jgi:site-specific DNA-cytosine methylase
LQRKNKMNILSLFDGKSCGQIALNELGIKYDNYFASEIDKYAIKVAQKNYPNTIQLGSVVNVKSETLPKIDLLIGGSPCQGFSFAGKQLNFNDPRSKLFFEFVRLKNECQPRYFLLENVPMRKEYQQVITDILGVEPIMINSNLFTAQDRKRIYWTNIPILELPRNCDMCISDIVGFYSEIPKKEDVFLEIKMHTKREFGVTISKKGRVRPHRLDASKSGISEIGTLVNPSDKCVTIIASHAPKTYKSNPFKIYELSQEECEQIQGVPLGYTACVTERQAKKMLGNGWTVPVIAHIFKGMSM